MSVDYSQLLTSEYSGQPNFVATVQLTANAIGDITSLIQSLPAAFDLDNAIAAQLDVDGQWIGFARTIGGVLIVQFFGFADDSTALGFSELTNPSTGGRFIELGEDTSQTATLADPEYLQLLRAKILQNNWDGSPGEFMTAIAEVIGVPTSVIDPGTNVVLIMPSQTIDPVLSQLLTGYDLLPRPAGTRYQFVFMASGYVWTTAGTAISPNLATVEKLTGTTAWDSSAFVASPSTHIYLSWTVLDITHYLMGGLSTNPSGSPNYPTLNNAIYNSGGVIEVYESGNNQGSFGTYAAGDTFAVYWDGKSAVYLHNGAPFKVTTPASSPGSLSPMFCLYSVGGQADNILISTG